MNKLPSLLLCLLLTACGAVLPTQRKDSAATRTADNAATRAAVEVIRATAPPPPMPSVTVSNIGHGVVTINPSPPAATIKVSTRTVAEANSNEKLDWMSSLTLPLGSKLLLLAAGTLAVVLVIKLILRSSAAAKAIAQRADEGLAERIRFHRSVAATSTDPVAMAQNNDAAAQLEALRGKIANNKP